MLTVTSTGNAGQLDTSPCPFCNTPGPRDRDHCDSCGNSYTEPCPCCDQGFIWPPLALDLTPSARASLGDPAARWDVMGIHHEDAMPQAFMYLHGRRACFVDSSEVLRFAKAA